jgi:hypothetical protein
MPKEEVLVFLQRFRGIGRKSAKEAVKRMRDLNQLVVDEEGRLALPPNLTEVPATAILPLGPYLDRISVPVSAREDKGRLRIVPLCDACSGLDFRWAPETYPLRPTVVPSGASFGGWSWVEIGFFSGLPGESD